MTNFLCKHCGKRLVGHGPFARCAGGKTQFEYEGPIFGVFVKSTPTARTWKGGFASIQEGVAWLDSRLPHGGEMNACVFDYRQDGLVVWERGA